MNQDVGSRGEAEAADPALLDVVARIEEPECAVDVLLPSPSPRVRRSLALAAAARVVDEDAVAVTAQQRCVGKRSSPRSPPPAWTSTTAAPFLEGEYHPESSRPSADSKVTGWYPLGGSGIGSRYLWVGTIAVAVGKSPRVDDKNANHDCDRSVDPTATRCGRSLAAMTPRNPERETDE